MYGYQPPGAPVAPAPVSVPTPPVFQLPGWGQNPYASSGLSAPGGAAPVGSTATVLDTLGNPVPAPGEADPEQLMGDIESSLAKLDTVNPDLANQFRTQYLGQPSQDEGGLLGFLGDVGHAITGGAGKILDLLGRTAHVVPAMFEAGLGYGEDSNDAVSAGWHALTGENKANWNQVFQDLGMDDGGVAGFLRATVGFGLDVATDPLTFMTFGAGAGASIGEKAALTAEEVATKLPTFLERGEVLAKAVGFDGKTEDLLAQAYNQFKNVPGRTEQAMQSMTDMAGHAIDDAHKALLGDMFEAADNTYNAVYARTFSKWLRKGEPMQLSSGAKVAPSDVDGLLEDAISRGAGHKPGDTEWLHARATAGAKGGIRITPYIPFTQFRYITPMIPGTNVIRPLSSVARFAAGKSSGAGMMKLVNAGAATWDDAALLAQKGLTALRQSSDPAQRRVYEALAARGRSASAWYSASERVGGLTLSVSPGAKLSRQGLAGYMAANFAKSNRGNMENIEHHLMYDVVGLEGKAHGLTGREYMFRSVKDAWGVTSDEGSDEAFDTMRRYLDTFAGVEGAPTGPKDVESGAFDQWFWERGDVQRELGAAPDDAARAELQKSLEAQLADSKEILGLVPVGPKRDALEMMGKVERRGHELVNEYGVLQGDARIPDFDSIKELYRDDVPLFNGQAHASAREGAWYVQAKTPRAGITDEDYVGHGDLGVAGVRASRTQEPGAVEVAVNPRKVLVLGEGDGVAGVFTDDPIVQAASERVDAQLADLRRTLDEQGVPVLPNSPLHELNLERTKAEMVTQDLKARGGLEYDSVLFRKPEGDELVLLGTQEHDAWNMVKEVSDNSTTSRVAATRGFFHRTFTKEAREYLYGAANGERLVRAVRDVAGKARRKTGHMTFDEAETASRRMLREEMTEQGVEQSVIDRLDTLPLFERNPMKVHEDYTHGVAESVNGQQTGEFLERMNSLGQLLPERFGRYSRIDPNQYKVDQALLKSVAQSFPKAAKAADKYKTKEVRLAEAVARQMEDDADSLSNAIRMFQQGDSTALSTLAIRNPKLQRLLDASDDLEATITRERTRAMDQLKVWNDRSDTLMHVENMLHDKDVVWRDLGDSIDPAEHLTWDDMPEGVARPSVNQEIEGMHGLEVSVEGGVEAGWPVDAHAAADNVDQMFLDEGIDAGQLKDVKPYNAEGGFPETLDAVARLDVTYDNASARLRRQPDGTWTVDSANVPVPDDASVISVYHGSPYVFDEPRTGRVSKGGGRTEGAGGDLFGPEHYVSTSPNMASDYATGVSAGDVPNVRRGVLRINKDAVFLADEEMPVAQVERIIAELPEDSAARRELEDALHNAETLRTVERGPDSNFPDAPGESGMSGEQVWDVLHERAGSTSEANDILERAGFEAIHYNGGVRMGGQHHHEAFAVFNPEKTIVHYGNWAKQAAENGRVTGDQLDDMLRRGELGIHPDGTVTTKAGRTRQAGKGGARKVYPASEVGAARQRLTQRLTDLELARGVPAVERKVGVVEQRLGQVGKEVERLTKERAVAAKANATRVARIQRETTNALNEMNTALAATNGLEAELKPAVVFGGASVGGREGMRQVNIPGLDGVWMHQFMAEEFDHVLGGKPIGALRNAWREFVLTPWKKWATYRSPGFHVRNFFGAWFNNQLGGVARADYDFAFRVMRARDGDAKWAASHLAPEDWKLLGLHRNANFNGLEKKLTYADMSNMLADHGIGRSNAMAVALTEQTSKDVPFWKAQAGHVVSGARKYDATMKKASSLTEDFFRTAAWSAGMRSTSGDLYGARAFVMTRHGDYSDLTDTEEFIKDLVPFYKWMRTNVPYQLRMLAEEPGKLLMVKKLQQSIYDASGVDADYVSSQPDWMVRGLNVPLPFLKDAAGNPEQLSMDLPYGDLYKGAREYLSSVLPIVSDVVESTVLKKDIFTGNDLTGKMKPVGGIWALPGMKQLMAALPGSMTGADGQVYIPDTFENILSAVPVYGRFRNWVSADPNRVEKRWGSITSFFAGTSLRGVDLNADEQAFYYDVLTPTLKMYQSAGYVFPSKDALQAAGLLAQDAADAPQANAVWPDGVAGTIPGWTTSTATAA